MSNIRLGGVYTVTAHSADGTPLWSEEFHNGTTGEGLDLALDVTFRSASASASWYVGLIDSSGFTGLSFADTAAAHAGWTEFTNYTEGTRQAWSAGAPVSGVISNSTQAVFTATTSASIRGVFLIDENTKGGTTGTLFSTGLLPAVRALSVTDTISVTYSLGISGG